MIRLRVPLLLLALLAFGAQQWAVRAHWHSTASVVAGLQAVAAEAGADRNAPVDGTGLPHPDCLWCQVATHAATAAPPASGFALLLVPSHDIVRPSAGRVAEFISPPAWSWHSRGPPAA